VTASQSPNWRDRKPLSDTRFSECRQLSLPSCTGTKAPAIYPDIMCTIVSAGSRAGVRFDEGRSPVTGEER